jgi:hypothetical protein
MVYKDRLTYIGKDMVCYMMNYPLLSVVRPMNKKQAEVVLRYLKSIGLLWHMEDHPEDIIWNGVDIKPTRKDIENLRRIQNDIWEICCPFELLDFVWDL